ncbi:MAG: PH domain-containing protein [Actinobacteria bacterium]|nr:PH domain-containing protein [Actinomycetota bacterium]
MPSSGSSQRSLPAEPRVRRTSYLRPDIDRHLLHDDGEIVIVEIAKPPVAAVGPAAWVVAGVAILVLMGFAGPGWWLMLLVGLGLAALGLFRVHELHMDRFVVTNLRVFRVHGTFERHVATLPLMRILDITVHQPFLGTLFNFGHLVFESAAQDQGLRDIKYVDDPFTMEHVIEPVIQRSGVRPIAVRRAATTEDDGT